MNPTLLPSPMGKIATICSTSVVNGRPGGENHKGELDFWRRTKPAFTVVAKMYYASGL